MSQPSTTKHSNGFQFGSEIMSKHNDSASVSSLIIQLSELIQIDEFVYNSLMSHFDWFMKKKKKMV